ncbi:MAG: phosphate signaling complex protein PhoU [candidate division Zixibacteria bacterium]|nr:phosphate signaling complex protein PhoU [candidate division Zixibacteria bacterium]
MTMLMHKGIDGLKNKVLVLGEAVQDNIALAVQSVAERNPTLADRVIHSDLFIDQAEVEIEEDCLKILALYQPVAIDLRYIVAVLKINNDLERIGDLAVNIAERAVFLQPQPPIETPYDLQGLADKVLWMVRNGLAAQMNLDADLARQVCRADDEVDTINRVMYDRVSEAIHHHSGLAHALIPYLTISRDLERIADHATNIAEDAIYLIEGDIARHRTEDINLASGKR